MNLSAGQIEDILRDTPEHLLDILSKVLRALLYNMNLPEDEVEDAVAKVKERKMARLFENVTMDIQAERRNTAEARAKLAVAREELNVAQQERDVAQQERNVAQQERDIYKHLLRLKSRHCSDAEIVASLVQHFHLTHAQAEETLKQAFEN